MSVPYNDAMTQLILKLDDETVSKVQAAAEREGLTRDEWLVKLVEERLSKSWPASVKQLSGAWPDFPDAETLREHHQDVPRETF